MLGENGGRLKGVLRRSVLRRCRLSYEGDRTRKMTPGRFDYKTRGLMILSRCVRSARLLRVIEFVSGVLLCRTSSASVLEMETARLGVKSAVQEANVSNDKPPQLVSGWRV